MEQKNVLVPNDGILDNLARLADDPLTAPKLWMRMPLAAGVNDDEGLPSPLRFTVDSVSGDAGGVFNNGSSLANQLVEKSALANIRPSYNGYYRFSHNFNLSFLFAEDLFKEKVLHTSPKPFYTFLLSEV